MARIRTLNFLPEVFQTPSNAEFLAATLDQIVNPPNAMKIQGYVGSKLGYGVNANDQYVPEPTKERTDYQLEPGVVFTKPDESVAKDFITYPGIVNALTMQGAITDDHSRLFKSQFYSWDSFCDLDKLINYNQYYWLPDGPPSVTIAAAIVYQNENYVVTDLPNGYSIAQEGSSIGSTNPTLTLLRGGTYTFAVNQDTQFWIQGEPGVSGYSPTQPNQPVRDVYGVSNNGATSGIVTFNVPAKDAQNQYDFPINNVVDVVATVPFDQINGQLLSDVGSIDGVTGLEGLRVVFYNTGIVDEVGFTSSYYAETEYDTNDNAIVAPLTLSVNGCSTTAFTLASGSTSVLNVNNTITFSGTTFGGVNIGQVYYINDIIDSTSFSISLEPNGDPITLSAATGVMTININQGLYEEGYYSVVADNYYRIQYVGATNNPILRLVPDGIINENEKITPAYGVEYANRPLFKNSLGAIQLIPYITAPLNTLYYQDGTSPNKVGIIRIIDSNLSNTINVVTDILGKKNYTSTNGVVFTNGLKVSFDGDVIPASYLQGEYYVEGVGTAIELVPVNELVCTEQFTQGEYVPWDMAGWDIGNYDINLYLPVLEDYITIARNSISKNAWSRSNRWFHIDVINATAQYNKSPETVNIATGSNKAKRPIIEFYPNLKLWNSGAIGKAPVDFIDFKATDALSTVAGALNYYPDIQVYTTATATIDSAVSATSTTVTVPVDAVTGTLEAYMYIGDSANILPNNAIITALSSDGTDYTMTVSWEDAQTIVGDTNISLVASATTIDNYNLFPGARIVFAADTDRNVRNKIYVAEFSVVTAGDPPVITLTLAEDGVVEIDTEIVVTRGYVNQGLSFWYNGLEWVSAQDKLNVNQPPLFDLYDANGISLGDNDYYSGTSFAGCKLFAYGIGTGSNDPVLGFPVKYSSVANVGDISFEVSLNADTFSYVRNGNPITENVNVGYVYNYTSGTDHVRQLGWENAIAPSVQYQVFDFEYDIANPATFLECDIAALPDLALDEKGWPRVKVFYNNVYQYGGYRSGAIPNADYTYSIGTNTTTITLINPPSINTPIQVLVLSDQVSNVAYYDVPINLTNNPLNQDLTSVNIGDIRLQYRDIFINSPLVQGEIFGPNNYRDCGNLVPYGTEIIQNSAAMVLPGAFLRSPSHNLFDALLFNSREYIKFKQLLVDTVQNTEYVQRYTPSTILDGALDQIAAARSEINAFFWSDMLPSKSPYISNTYVFNNDLDTTIYPLSQVYDFDNANYNGVLVYLLRTVDNVPVEKQLLSGFDYTISTTSPSLTITTPLLNGDRVVIKEYNQTYGSYVPNTPTKLGIYPAFEPAVVLDSDYMIPTYFIRGHDGSYTKLYGDYNAELGVLVDFRDQALLEFETRIYNNLKLSDIVPIRDYEILPGYFRQGVSTYSYDEFLEMYSPMFLNWVGQNRLDYKTQYYSKVAEFTYNYTNSAYKTNQKPIQQGYWRGVYSYLYDTTAPNETPWEMLGFSIMPDWWTTRYGPAPYTSDNLILWGDLEAGYVWNNGASYVVPELARPGLSEVIPVDSAGKLLSPFRAVVGNYNPSTFQKDWKVGDMAPVELSYRRSSTWPFDLVRLFALTRPAEFYNLAVDLDVYKYNTEFDQYLVNDRRHLQLSDIQVYGNGTPVTSYVNWIVDYEKQQGIDATTNIKTMLNNMDVRLIYRLAGYSDKTLLNFYVEKGSPNSRNASLLIPDESYSVLLYENQPFDKIMFSGVIVQQNDGYWTVYGNSQNFAYFTIQNPKYNGQWKELQVEKQKVKVTTSYENTTSLVPYGTKFYSTQDVAQFLLSYGAHLETQGMMFDEVQNGIHVTWNQMVLEFLYWTQTGWETGSIITLNPAAQNMDINPASAVVQPLTIQQQNFILNQNLYPIQLNDLCVNRDGTNFHVHTLNDGDTMAYGQFNLSNFEHGIVFDNTTLFNDVLYSTVTGLRQNRIYVRGTKTAEWNGTVDTWGFILNQDNVQEWNGNLKYTKGVIVKYKNKYWTSLKIVEPSKIFNEQEWKQINYADIQKGLLANPSTRAYESTLYYNVYEANLEQDADLLSFSLIGYRPRDYLALIDLTDTAQVQVYKNLIKNKGTRNAVEAFKGANLPQGGIKYDVYENWAIQSGSYGGVLNENFVDFKVNQKYMTGDPSIVSLTNGMPTEGSMQEIQLANLFNYGVAPTTPDVLNTTTTPDNTLYPSAGYVNYNDVKMATYFYSGLPYATDVNGKIIPIQNFYVGEYMWLANFKEKWNVFRWKTIGQVLQVRGNTNGTATITFNVPHGLKKLDPVSIINFATNVDGYYLVSDVVSLNEVIINLSLVGASNGALQGRGLGFAFESQRVATPSEIAALNLTENEFVKNTVWVDENYDGSWAVYRKSINYLEQGQLETGDLGTYGSAVAYTSTSGYLISDPSEGKVYRYSYSADSQTYTVGETLTGSASFGSAIAYAGNIYAISQPTTSPRVKIYTINNSVLSDDFLLYQAAITAPVGVTDWGSKLAMSDDSNWLYISALNVAKVYVYRKQQINLDAGYFTAGETYVITTVGTTDFTAIGAIENKVGIAFVATGAGSGTGKATQASYKLANIIDGASIGLTSADKFGTSLSTTNRGNTLVVGAPNVDYSGSITNWGAAYVFAKTEQNYEAPYNSVTYRPQSITLAWTPANIAGKASTSVTSGQYINVSSTTGLEVNMPVIFAGSNFGSTGIEPNVVYYIAALSGGNKFSIKSSRNTNTAITLTNASGLSFTAYAQSNPLYVTVNGVLVDDNNYATIGNTFYYVTPLRAGDIVNISDSQFYMIQEFNSKYTTRGDAYFGTAVDNTKFGSDIVVGSPFEISADNKEGAVYSFINGGAKYGIVIGTSECNVTAARKLLINGYLITLTAGDATDIAQQINNNKITNVEAAATVDNKLIIQLVDNALAPVDEKLLITVFDNNVLSELGINVYANTQIVTCPRGEGPTQFGANVKINEAKTMLVSAPVGTRYEGTFFDFTDDENLDNDTVFDNNATQFVDSYPNAGAVYMFDYLSNSNETLAKPGAFAYAQSVNDTVLDYGQNPGYGLALEFNDNVVMVGSPDFQSITVGGKAVIYTNSTGLTDWIEYRQSAPIVDIEKIQNSQLYSASTNNTLVNFDYPDPLQNKLLGAARQNLDYVTGVDPANYNVNYAPQSGMVWGADHVGKMWFDTTNVRWMNYHQNDVVYNSRHWAQVFPGSDVAVYTWVASYVLPVNYQGPGTPYDANQYAVNSTINSSGVIVPIYYFWVRNTNIIAEKLGKTLSDSIVASYIANPRGSGIPFMAPLLPNTFAMYNSGQYFNGNDSVFHIGYSNGASDDVAHNEYSLIRTDFADDFLPGLPSSANGTHGEPYSLYAKMLDSLAGADQIGNVVPNPLLPLAVQQGVLNVPRQSFFYNRYAALNNYLSYANTVLLQYPIVEIKEDLSFLYTSGEFYDTQDYWEFVNWWAPGYSNSTQTVLQVAVYGDLSALTNVATGTLVKVEKNGAGKYEVYRYDGEGVWTRVGLQNGTLQFKNYLWNYSAGKLGFSGNFFDTDSYDSYPSEETRNIIRALNEQIYTGELLIHRNKSLILLFDFIQAETIESQNYLPWLNKTSLADVSHTIRELKPYEVYKTDDQVFLSEYINEVKPYHVVIKDFLFNYTGAELFEGDITDFDVPAAYNPTYQEFISPQLVYTTGTNSQYQYTYNDNIWQTAPYTQWFQNYGLSMGNPVYQSGTVVGYVGQKNYPITTLKSYITRGTTYMLVDNASGFPINGVVTIGKEKIGYSYVDRALNLLGGLVRGVDGTKIVDHLPSEQIYIDLPSVLLLSGGRGYSNPPRITAVIDTTIYPEPTVAAEFEAVMNLDSVLQINVINPGKGYAVLPEIVIEPSITTIFSSADIVPALNTLSVFAPDFRTGDLVQYKNGVGPGCGGLVDGEWYYINVLETAPATVIALYTNYKDAIRDQHRVDLSVLGSTSGMTLNLGAKAIAITDATPTRELNTTIKFDRTSYQSQIQDWQAGTFYGAFFAGSYYNTDNLASTNITLENTSPDINNLLASAHSVVFEVVDVENERQLTWSSFVREVNQTLAVNDAVRLTPLDDGSSNPNASGTTIGFYKNMPVKFGGTTVGGIVNGKTYYVSEILNDIDFTISESIDGPVFALSTATVTVPMYCYTGQVVDQAVLTVNYPGIMTATATTAEINSITIPLSAIGTGGTNGFYPGVTLFFTATNPGEEMFGNVVENQVYYVNTIIDEQTFTISETTTNVTTNIDNQPFSTVEAHVIYSTTVTGTATGTNIVTVDSTADFAINDRIIFNSMVIGGNSVTSFGNIVSGNLYYVSEIISETEMTISQSVNGAVVSLANATGTAMVTNQKNTVTLTTATGSMTTNVALPVSPGQVNGQQFSMYQTSEPYPNITGSVEGLLNRTVYASIGTNFSVAVNRLAVDDTTWFYSNMPFQVASSVGGLSTSTTYYVKEYSGMEDPLNPGEYLKNIYLVADATIAGNTTPGTNKITCNGDYDTSSLYEGMGIIFSGVGLGGIEIGQEYFVKTIVDSTHFTISEIPNGTEFKLTADLGTMAGTGSPWITVSSSPGGSVLSLSNSTPYISPIELDQIITSNPLFDMSYILGGYRAIIQDGGSGFAITNTISIPGTEVGGTSPENDLTLTVNTIDENGAITSVIINGTPAGITTDYYFKIRGANQFEVYTNSLMTIPASGLTLPYTGFTTASVTGYSGSTITVSDSSGFEVNDQVVFTGNVVSPLVLGQPYFIVAKATGTISVAENIGDPAITVGTQAGINFTVAKAGSFAFLSEPFYFSPSIIRFNNRLYTCLVSNNDTEFVIGKWELVNPGDRNINAMDRVIGYYQPTVNMPGVDLTQVFEGVTYPNATYMGNAFEPDMQFDLDVVLQDQPFYPTDVQLNGIVYTDGYYAASNLTDYSALVYSADGESWLAAQLTSSNINLTDIVYADGTYIMTSTNPTTPIYRSNDGRQWTTNGTYTPWDSNGWSDSNYDITSLETSAIALQSAAYFNGWIAVGDSILRSTDTYHWQEVKTYLPDRNNQLYGVTAVATSQFTGAVAVGQTTILGYDNGLPILVPANLISWSTDGLAWIDVNPVTTKTFYAVAANATKIIATGQNGVIYYSYNATDWFGLNEASVSSFSTTNNIISISASGFQVGDAIKFNNSFSSIVAGTTYYVKSIVSPTLITISATNGGPTKTLTAGSVPAGTIVYSYGSTPDLHDMTYANSIWMAVGDNGTIKTSSDGVVWTTQSSGTTENLNGITYSEELEKFIVVGDNNTIITSDDSGVTWTSISLFEVLPAIHTVKGADFPYGYGPEELVPGVVRDNLAMTVTTRPGTNWPVTEYAHTGYNVLSYELLPTSELQTVYSIDSVAEYAAQVFVQVINPTTNLGTTLYQGIDYTVNWQTKSIVLNTPLSISPMQKLRVDIYEVGNGDQLVKSCSDVDPIRTNDVTGFNEIYVNCNYSATIYQGSGVIRPGTFDRSIIATATQAITNRITCEEVSQLVLGEPVTFSGDLLGGLEAGVTYYVKSISAATQTITVSNYYDVNAGVAGATVPLTTDIGTMYVNISIGSDQVWTSPILYNNGVKQIQGYSSQVTQTVASNNSIIANSTAGLAPGAPVMFSNTMFGTAIQPLTRYYVVDVLTATSFTISETQGGPVLVLEDALGGAEYISYDYAFGIQPNGTSAKIVFPNNDLTVDNNYIVYSLFGETTPEQYGYTIPETQLLVGDGSTKTFSLDNYLGEGNAEYAVVEINGLRLIPSAYTIDFNDNTITFVTAPANQANIAVTTFNDTTQQYFTVQSTTSFSSTKIANVNNQLSSPIAVTVATASSSTGNKITVTSTSNFIVGQTVEFRGTSFGGIATNGTVYFVDSIVDGTHFTIKNAAGTQITLSNDSGTLSVTVGGLSTTRITTSTPSGFTTNTQVRIDGVLGSTQLNDNSYYVRVITPTVFDLYEAPFNGGANAVNYPVTLVSNYIAGGFVWQQGLLYIHSITASATNGTLNRITVTGDTDDLEFGTPVYFAAASTANGTDILGGLVQGTEYYVHTVYSATQFSVSATRGGEEFDLYTDTGTVYVTQWSQFNPERLWVTINGYRVPSSQLKLYDFNEVGILASISTGDEVVISSMIPSATPNGEQYINFVDDFGVPSVYRIQAYSKTWITEPLYPLSTTISVNDINALVVTTTQNATAPVDFNGYYTIGLDANKRELKTVSVMNNTTGMKIDASAISISLVDAAPVVNIAVGDYISIGDSLTLTIYQGNTVYINGEQIGYSGVDYDNDMLTGIKRGQNGTAQQYYIPAETQIIGLLEKNRLPDEYYDQTWNSYVYNTVQGDPLQISDTAAAQFLNPDNS